MSHLKVKDLIKKLKQYDPEAKVIFYNDEGYNMGMYYVTGVHFWKNNENCFIGEDQVELETDYKTIAKGWEE